MNGRLLTQIVGRVYDKLLEFLAAIGGCGIVAIAILICLDIVARAFTYSTFQWSTEVSEYLLFVSALLAAPWVLRENGHVRMDILLQTRNRLRRACIEIGASCLGGLICLPLIWYSWISAARAFNANAQHYKILTVPEWWLLALIPVTMTLLFIEFGRGLLRVSKHDRPNH